jgi:hypothetical protein
MARAMPVEALLFDVFGTADFVALADALGA